MIFKRIVGIQHRQSVKTIKKKRTAISISFGASGVAVRVRRMLRNKAVYTPTITKTLHQIRTFFVLFLDKNKKKYHREQKDILPRAVDANVEKGRILPTERQWFVNVQRKAEAVAAMMMTHSAPVEH